MMTLYSADKSPLMQISAIERDGSDLVIKGKAFGAMPMTARLTPAEARLATFLAAGLPLHVAAQRASVGLGTARNYLQRIFRKTGTHQQGQLVALLKTVHPFPAH